MDIREGLIDILAERNCRTLATPILQYLRSQKVKRVVDRELPLPRYPNSEIDAYIWEGQQDMLKAGYVAVEEL